MVNIDIQDAHFPAGFDGIQRGTEIFYLVNSLSQAVPEDGHLFIGEVFREEIDGMVPMLCQIFREFKLLGQFNHAPGTVVGNDAQEGNLVAQKGLQFHGVEAETAVANKAQPDPAACRIRRPPRLRPHPCRAKEQKEK